MHAYARFLEHNYSEDEVYWIKHYLKQVVFTNTGLRIDPKTKKITYDENMAGSQSCPIFTG